MDTVRENILKNIETTLTAISIATPNTNGYVNTIASVQRWKWQGNSLRNVPCIIISGGEENKQPQPNPFMTCTFAVYIEIYIRQEKTDINPTDSLINSVLGDVEKAIMLDNTRGGYAKDSIVKRILPFETQTGQANAGAIVELEITYQHKQTDPATSG